LVKGHIGAFTCVVFVAEEECLDVGFGVAQARLTNLLRTGALITSSVDCYEQGLTGPAQVVLLGSAPDVAKLAKVQVGELVIRGDSARLPLTWYATGPAGGLFPAVDADLGLIALSDDATTLRLAGAYRAPPGIADAGLDRAVLQRVATATIQAFIRRVADAIVHPAVALAPRREDPGLSP
jgi:hypothetical protein